MTGKGRNIGASSRQKGRTGLPWEHVPSFDPVSLLVRMRDRDAGAPLVHIDRERTTGWSYVPVRTGRVREDWGSLPGLRTGGPAAASWDGHRLLASPAGGSPPEALTSDPPEIPPFTSGAILLLPYDMAELWEPSGGAVRMPAVPAILVDCLEVVAFHRPSGRLFLPPGFDRALLDPVSFRKNAPVTFSPSHDRPAFAALMAPVGAAISAGEYFQLNLSLRFDADLPGEFDPLSAYARMRGSVRPLFGGFFSLGGRYILSQSPEQLLTLSGEVLRSFPIAGTAKGERPDGPDPLLSDPKLLAEHIMIVDLLRNDIGRVARPGSVRVPRFLSVESYPHLRHLVSEVRGTVRESVTRAEVIKALFPGGSVTGAPKIRVRAHTWLLEGEPRNYYCGALGFVSDSGLVDLALLIRSLEGDPRGQGEGRAVLRVGAGIVADSDPDSEYTEILLKAQVFREGLSG